MSRGYHYPNSFADVGIHLTVLPKGVGNYEDLPDPVWIAAGGVPSPAHQADVVIKIEPPDAGVQIQVGLINGKGQERHATLAFSHQTVMAGGGPVLLKTNDSGVFTGVLTSSDTTGYCTVQVSVPGTTNKVERTVVFNGMWEEASEVDKILGGQYYHTPEVGLITITMRLVHYRAPDHKAPKLPLDNHEIRCFVEEILYVDENEERHVIINTPDYPTEAVNDWAVFLSPVQTDSNGYATVVLDVRRAGIDRMRIGTYYWSVYNDPTPKYDSRFGIKLFRDISFNDATLQAVVHRLNQHLQAEDAFSTEHASDMQMIPIREVQLELPDGMTGEPVTLSFADIAFDQVLEILTQIEEVTYQVDGNIIRIVPSFHNRPILRDGLNLESVVQRLESAFMKQSICLHFSEAGLAKALAEKLAEARVVDDAFGNSEITVLTKSGHQQFIDLIPTWFPDSREVRAAMQGRYSDLVGTPVVGGVQILRASFEANATALVFSDIKTNESVPINLDSVCGVVYYDDNGRSHSFSKKDASVNVRDNWDFVQFIPQLKPGIYVYYEVGIEQIRPEDKDYFDWEQRRLDQLFEHELGYFVRAPKYLASPLSARKCCWY